MNPAHAHLLVNHLPIFGVLIGILLHAGGYLFRSEAVRRAALVVYIGVAGATMVSNVTGEKAEEPVEELPGVDHGFIHAHEEEAETALMLCIALGVMSAGALFLSVRKKDIGKYAEPVSLLMAGICFYLLIGVGSSGGQIRHTEIREGAAAVSGGEENHEAGEAEHEDDH